jgi:predicted Rossmann fold nucleotide-binding protein DprA/Smf involved in DNA uptake
MTMPGNIDQPLSAGTNWLAQQGAQIITSGQDITDALHLQTATQTNNNYITDDPLMQEILQKIQTSAMRLEDLSDQLTNYDQTMITIAISKLELRGWIERRVGNYIQLR